MQKVLGVRYQVLGCFVEALGLGGDKSVFSMLRIVRFYSSPPLKKEG
jgi:hypothetical protein